MLNPENGAENLWRPHSQDKVHHALNSMIREYHPSYPNTILLKSSNNNRGLQWIDLWESEEQPIVKPQSQEGKSTEIGRGILSHLFL